MKEKIEQRLKKVGITEKKLFKIRKKMLDFLSGNKELPKLDRVEKEKLKILKDFYRQGQEQNQSLAEDLFKKHRDLLGSKNLKVQIEALKELEKLARKYEVDLYNKERDNEMVKTEKKRKPSVMLKHRHKIKSQLERKLPPKNKHGTQGEAIIRDMARMDFYPDVNESSKGISPWFRVDIKGLYYGGLEVFLRKPECITFDKKKQEWRFAKDREKNKIFSFPVGRIPFGNIREIDWRGDEHYRCPHIYCDFKNGQPYELVVFYIDCTRGKDIYFSLVEGFYPYQR